ncbi:MAG: archaellin/type IV pilin N-terminal domain-containing protein [Thermoplasmata archaeon]
MNVFGQSARSWRKARKRAVSPIIATILLVAITVVLAAVLYVLISGLTHGPGSAPLGTNFGWGQPDNATGTAIIGCAAATGHYCYSIEIASAGGGITTTSVDLSLRNAAGGTVAWPTGGVTISLVSPSSTLAIATYSITTNAWAPVGTFSGAFASGQSIVVYTTTGTGSQGMFGDALVAIGSNGYSGTVASASFS